MSRISFFGRNQNVEHRSNEGLRSSAAAGTAYTEAATALITFTPGTANAPASVIVNYIDNNGISGTGTSTVLTVNPAGFSNANTILVFSAKETTACVDSRGNTYTKDAGIAGSGTSIGTSVWRKDPGGSALVSGDTITLTHGNLAGRVAIAMEVSGFLGSPVEASVTATSDYNSTGRTSGSFNGSAATAGTKARIFSAWTLDFSASAPVAGSGYTIEDSAASSGTVRTLVVQDQIVNSGITPTSDLSWTGSSASQTGLVIAYDVSVGTVAEAMQSTDSGTALITFTPSAADVVEHFDAATALVSFTPATVADIHATVDSGTGLVSFTPSAVEGREGIDAATAAVTFTTTTVLDWFAGVDQATGLVTFTTSGAETAQYAETPTGLVTFTPSGVDLKFAVDTATALVTFSPGPNVATKLFHDIFDRVVATDLGTATDGTPWIKLSAVSTDVSVDGTKAITNMPVTLNRTYQYKVTIPNIDTVSTIVFAPSVLTSQSASNYIWEWKVRDSGIQAAGDNGYVFRFLLQPTGNMQVLLARLDNNVQATLVAATIVTGGASGAWTLADTFTAECVMVGTVMQAYVWRTAGGRPRNPTVSYDTSGDATQYSNGPAFSTRIVPNGATSGSDEAWYWYSIDVADASENIQAVDQNAALVTFTPGGTNTFQGVDSALATVLFTTSATEQEIHTDSDTAFLTLTPITTVEQTIHTDSATSTVTFTASAVEAKQNVDAATINSVYTPSGTDSLSHADAATASVTFTSSGVDAYSSTDSATSTLTFTPSALEVKAKEYTETATSTVTFTPGGFETQLGSGDAATANSTYTPSATETRQQQDDEQGLVSFIPSSTEVVQLTTTGTAIVSFIPIAQAEPFSSVDADTAVVNFTANAIRELLVRFDSYLVAVATYKRWSASHVSFVSATAFKRYTATAEGRRWIATDRGRGFLGQ